MRLQDIKDNLIETDKLKVDELRPSQEKAVNAGLFEGKNLLICTPTASGKTLAGEFGFLNAIKKGKKALYIVPLKALATEKYKDFLRYDFRTTVSIGDLDSDSGYLANYDLIICTSEKLDSLMRHHTPWLKDVGCIIIDEIHLINDPSRGPTLEILITLFKKMLNAQLIGLSATIGNPEELAQWLGAEMVVDKWRPVELKEGVHHQTTEWQ